MRAIGYKRVSTLSQGEDGLSMEAQERSIGDTAMMRGWELVDVEEDVISTRKSAKQHGLARALARLEAGEADVLIVTKLDRLARSTLEGANIVKRAREGGFELVVIELGLDTTTPHGAFAVSIMFAFAELERTMISERTKTALKEARRRGTQLGRRAGTIEVAPEARVAIQQLREQGLSLRAIGAALVELGHAPPRASSSTWSPQTIANALMAEAA
jgi:DNA invertase Pin-like site-specific DNA recombinase